MSYTDETIAKHCLSTFKFPSSAVQWTAQLSRHHEQSIEDVSITESVLQSCTAEEEAGKVVEKGLLTPPDVRGHHLGSHSWPAELRTYK